MIDWEEIIKAETVEELKEAKLWLFKENMRIENEKRELILLEDKLSKEKDTFRDEINALNHRFVMERNRLKQENLFFEKKMAILQDGFRSLEEDRKEFERIKKNDEKKLISKNLPVNNSISILFRNVNNIITLKKRYRDLIKIFHPDNLCGDEELVQLINKEFLRCKEEW